MTMIKSMTGFGQAESTISGRALTIELRSVNSRYAELTLRLPKSLAGLEPKARAYLQGRLRRGSASLTVNWGQGRETDLPEIDLETARHYHRLLKALRKELGLEGKIDVRTLVGFSDIFASPHQQAVPAEAWAALRPALDQALDDLERMKAAEGQRLSMAIGQGLKRIGRLADQVTKLGPQRAAAYQRSMGQRLQKLNRGRGIDPARLAQETAILADRLDITEECVRLHSHRKAFAASLELAQPVGKRLDFLLQEMHREANTIGSKANDARISQLAVQLKEEIEKIREQVQNIE
jgi:uncharacterized protein (TIGR00255 family)